MDNERLADLERRVQALEQAFFRNMLPGTSTEQALIAQYGETVDKTVAAKILGVTRATVYAMLTDGRILGACNGHRVSVRSIAKYIASSNVTAYSRKEQSEK